jgi:Icc protein
MQRPAPFTVLQITDLHLLAEPGARLLGVDTALSLDAVLTAALAEQQPAALLVTGDIAHNPTPAAYARTRTLIGQHFQGEVLWLAGNHDHGAMLAERAPRVELRLGDWQILTLDTHRDDVTAGGVAPAELQRLSDCLACSTARHVLVVGHHPPLPVGTSWLDRDSISNGSELLALLSADGRVRAYACGHVHQENALQHADIAVLTTPSTCFQFVPGTQRFTVDATPPGWRWLELGHDGTLRTRVGRATHFAVTLDLSTFVKH